MIIKQESDDLLAFVGEWGHVVNDHDRHKDSDECAWDGR